MTKLLQVKCTWKRIVLALLLFTTFTIIFAFLYSETERKEKTKLILNAMGSRITADFVQPATDTILIEPDPKSRLLCNHAYTVIMITSKPNDVARRNAIRLTWAQWQKEYDIVVFFFTAAKRQLEKDALQSEFETYGDLIVDEMEENKYHLTVKNLRLLKWFIKNCPRADFLIKADDDAFLNIPVLINHLHGINSTTLSKGYIGGLVHEGRAPHSRNPFSKWYVPPELWEKGIYPPYVDSVCIILSGKIVSHIFMASLNVPLFHISEIFITGIVASQYLQMELNDVPSIYDGQWPEVNYFLKSVEFLQTNIAYHCPGDYKLMQKLYTNSRAVNDINNDDDNKFAVDES